MHTDILETLRIIHEAFENAPQEAQKRVLYLSDMHESMPGAGRRDFDTRPPTSIEQAYEWADEDSRRLRAQGIVPEGALAGVKVRVLTSTLGIGPNAKFIRSYWQRIFENFNADVRFG